MTNSMCILMGTFCLFLTPFLMAKSVIHQDYSDTADQYEVDGRVISNVDTSAPLWNPRGKSKANLKERALFLAEAYDLTRSSAQEERAKKAREKYQDAIYINSLMIGSIGEVEVTEAQFLKGVQRNLDAGATVVSATAYAFPSDGPMPILVRLDKSNKVMADQGIVFVQDTQSIRQAKKDGKIGVIFNAQGAEWAIDDLSILHEVQFDVFMRLARVSVRNLYPPIFRRGQWAF